MYCGDEQSELDLQLFRVLMKSTKVIMDYAKRDILERGISFENFVVLELLYNRGPHPIQKISERLNIASGSITYVVNKLEKEGLIIREQCDKDARKWYIALSEQGEALFDDIFPKHVEAISQSLAFITSEEKKILVEKLKKMTAGISPME